MIATEFWFLVRIFQMILYYNPILRCSHINLLTAQQIYMRVGYFQFCPLCDTIFPLPRGEAENSYQIWIQHLKKYISTYETYKNNSVQILPPCGNCFISRAGVNHKNYTKFEFNAPQNIEFDEN